MLTFDGCVYGFAHRAGKMRNKHSYVLQHEVLVPDNHDASLGLL